MPVEDERLRSMSGRTRGFPPGARGNDEDGRKYAEKRPRIGALQLNATFQPY